MKTLLAVPILALVLIVPTPVLACGSAVMMLSGYWDPALSPEEKADLLSTVGCGDHVNYAPREDDPIIAEILVDAIEKGLPRDVIEGVLKRFHCAYAARRSSSYITIRSFIGDEEFAAFCNVAYLERLVIVQAQSGVVLRDTPSVSGKRVDAIPKGAYIEILADNGDWYEVDAKLYGRGFVHKQLVTKY